MSKGKAATESNEYKQWAEAVDLPVTVFGGTSAMVDAGTKYLPRHPLEGRLAYDMRLKQGVLLNAVARTIGLYEGMVFKGGLTLADELDQSVKAMLQTSATSGGAGIDTVARRIFCHGLCSGCGHVMVDAPIFDAEAVSKADAKKAGLRPFMRVVDPKSVIGHQESRGKVTQVRLAEVALEPDGDYEIKSSNQVRVLNADGTWLLIDDDDAKIDSGVVGVKALQLVTYTPGNSLNAMYGDSPLEDLAHINRAHWQSTCDQRRILSVARVPILFGRHVELREMPVSVAEMILSSKDNSDIKYIEVTGAAIKAGADDLADLEHKLALWGLQQLVPRVGNQTATEKQLTSNEANSMLAVWAGELEDVLCNAVDLFCEFAGVPTVERAVTLRKEYDIKSMSGDDAKIYNDFIDRHVLDPETVFLEAQRRGFLDKKLDWADIKAGIDNNSMLAGGGLFG